jgi:hypothetical protein
MRNLPTRNIESDYDVQDEINDEIKGLEIQLKHINSNQKRKNKRIIILSLIETLTEELRNLEK